MNEMEAWDLGRMAYYDDPFDELNRNPYKPFSRRWHAFEEGYYNEANLSSRD